MILILVSALLILLISKIVQYLFQLTRFYRKVSTLPSPPGHWLTGHHDILQGIEKTSGGNTSEALYQYAEAVSKVEQFKKKGLFVIWLGPMPVVLVTRPEPTELLLRRPNLPKSFTYKALDMAIGKGLVNSNGYHWKSHRKLLSPAFDFGMMDNFIPSLTKNTDILLTAFQDSIDKKDGIIEDITPLFASTSFAILSDIAIGITRDTHSEIFRKVDKALVESANIIVDRMMKPWLLNDFLFSFTSDGKKLNRLLNEVIYPYIDSVYQEKRDKAVKILKQQLDTTNDDGDRGKSTEKLSFVDILIRENLRRPHEFTEADVQSEFRTFLSAGYETTTSALAWTFFLLGNHPEIQDKIHDEIKSILSDDPDRQMTMSDLKELRYTEAVVKEAHRYYSPVPMFARDADEDIEISFDDGTQGVIPKGILILFYPPFVHHNSDHWTEPHKFQPERFLFSNESSRERRHPYSYIPFSAGSRNCVGQKFTMSQEKAIVARVCQTYKFKSLAAVGGIPATPHVSYRPAKEISIEVWKR